MAMTIRRARRLLALALGVAGLTLAAGAPGASAVTLDCTGTATWTFNPPLGITSTPRTVTVQESLAACTGDAAATAATGTSTNPYTITGNCEGVTYQQTGGTKQFAWMPFSNSSRFSYTLTGGTGLVGLDLPLRGTISSGLFNGRSATEQLQVTQLPRLNLIAMCKFGLTFRTLTGTAHLTIN
jgi:hypothetical protein